MVSNIEFQGVSMIKQTAPHLACSLDSAEGRFPLGGKAY